MEIVVILGCAHELVDAPVFRCPRLVRGTSAVVEVSEVLRGLLEYVVRVTHPELGLIYCVLVIKWLRSLVGVHV